MAKALKPVKKKGGKNAYKMPEPLPPGLLLEDTAKKQWRIGASIGKGGFGEIYEAQEAAGAASKQYPYVIKIEPHENGPLFVEMHVYMRIAKDADIKEYQTQHKMKTFGMPAIFGCGTHEHAGQNYRFIILEKFGTDLQKIYVEHGRKFPTETVFKLSLQILDVLEYIHSKDYVHADIKGANILMGLKKDTKNQAYLVDFGLATKFTTAKEFKANPKKAHDGTIEYLSRDAHKGVPTRRGDLEILAYNIIHWLGGQLPWDNNLKDPNVVQQSKENAMNDVKSFVESCFDSLDSNVPNGLLQYLKYLTSLQFNTKPNYKKIQEIFASEIKSINGALQFEKIGAKKKTPTKRRMLKDDEIAVAPAVDAKISKKVKKSGGKSVVVPPSGDDLMINDDKKEVDENIVENNNVISSPVDTKLATKKTVRKMKKNDGALLTVPENLTAEMAEVIEKKKKKKGGVIPKRSNDDDDDDKVDENTKVTVRKVKKMPDEGPSLLSGLNNLTPAMAEVIAKRNAKLQVNLTGFTAEMTEQLLKKKNRELKTDVVAENVNSNGITNGDGFVAGTTRMMGERPKRNLSRVKYTE